MTTKPMNRDEKGELQHLAAMCGIDCGFPANPAKIRAALEEQKVKCAGFVNQHIMALDQYLERFGY